MRMMYLKSVNDKGILEKNPSAPIRSDRMRVLLSGVEPKTFRNT